jgi:DNA-binding transcriptional MerR regulator
VSSRTYLSIGDVLTLLREEFPDVTISKIRFLESQGLVNPERSPSGYRKFFEHDVERLRWVLRQQREHFLPLKVIRDRLADGELDDSGLELENGKPLEVDAGHGTADDEQPTKADEAAMARILADASRRTALMPEAAQARRGLQVLDEGEATTSEAITSGATAGGATTSGASQTAAGPAASTPATVAGTTVAADATPPAPPPAPPPARTSSASPPVGAGPKHAATAAKGSGRANGATQPGRPGSTPAAERAPSDPPAAGSPPPPPPAAVPSPPSAQRGQSGAQGATAGAAAAIVTGASMTADEICAASGLSRDELMGLQGFGLLCPVQVAGMDTYDEEALTVANLAAAFRGFGIEPRHLRLYRNAADRELGLIEQVVIPLLRQRNPESRQRAVESADQLAALGQSMRASLLRQALRQHFGG